MEANGLLDKLKANGSESDFYDIDVIYQDYLSICKKLPAKDKAAFALNILCMVCRNLDKVPSWKCSVDSKKIINLCIFCSDHTKVWSKEQRIKVLACHYHLHKYAVSQKIPSELVLQLSHIPFQNDLLSDYAKTYWAIIVDRMSFIDKYKALNADIVKILPQLTSDIVKMMSIYDIGMLCKDILNILIKKMFFIYGEKYNKQLNDSFNSIFAVFNDRNVVFKESSYDVFQRLCDCFCVLHENGLKTQNTVNFEQIFVPVFANNTDIGQTIKFFNSKILDLDNLLVINNSIQNETKAILISLPYYNNVLRLKIEHMTQNGAEKWRETMPMSLQEEIFKIIISIMKKLSKCEQLSKCENCSLKNGFHDSLRIGFASKLIITTSLTHGMDVRPILDLNFELIELQNSIISKLEGKCCNIEKYLFKNQSNIHNIAIMLYQMKYYEHSKNLFEMYLIKEFQGDIDKKNVTRGLYNKAICELDSKDFNNAIKSAYLSLIFSMPEGAMSEKYTSLIIDIKSKAQDDAILTMTVLKFCHEFDRSNSYGCLMRVFGGLDFCPLLNHEFNMYCQLWPSTPPISGIWSTYMEMLRGKYVWITVNESQILDCLIKIILKTCDIIRSIHYDVFNNIVNELIVILEEKKDIIKYKAIHATLLILKSEFDFAEASDKHDWKIIDKTKDPESVTINKTISQEYVVVAPTLKAVTLWTDILAKISQDSSLKEWLPLCLPVLELGTQFLLNMDQIGHALQMAFICTQISLFIQHKTTFLTHTSILLYHSEIESTSVNKLFENISKNIHLYLNNECTELLLNCLCDAAIYMTRIGRNNLALKLIEYVQINLLNDFKNSQILYEGTTARLLEALNMTCDPAPVSKLSAVFTIQKRWFAININKTTWLSRRTKSLHLKYNCAISTQNCATLSRSLYLWRRGRSSICNALGMVCAGKIAQYYIDIVNVYKSDDAQEKIENRLKYILYSLETKKTSNDTSVIKEKSIELNSNRIDTFETMLRSKNLNKNSISPLSITSIPAFKIPEFFLHKKACLCHLCLNPNCYILSLEIIKLESSMYFRNNEFEIARNYFNGGVKMVDNVRMKIDNFCEHLKQLHYEIFVIDVIKNVLEKKLIKIHIEILIEYAFFDLSQNNTKNSDDSIIQIRELIQENRLDEYTIDSYMNLVAASNKIKEKSPKIRTESLEIEFDNLKISPKANYLQKTPENKIQKPIKSKVLTKFTEDEIPKLNLRVKKLNLDNPSPEKVEITESVEKVEFKIPEPKTSKLIPESITLRHTRSKPKLLLTQPSLDASVCTPKQGDKTEFFTPKTGETPGFEEFFTPQSTVKTYARKGLRGQIVKNLERDFKANEIVNKDIKNELINEKVSKKSESHKYGNENEPKKSESQKKPKSVVDHNRNNHKKMESVSMTNEIALKKSASHKKSESDSIKNEKVLINSDSHKKLESESMTNEIALKKSASHKKSESDSIKNEKVLINSDSHKKLESDSMPNEKVFKKSISHKKLESESMPNEKVLKRSESRKKLERESILNKKIVEDDKTRSKLEAGSIRNKSALKRATSPGKLVKEERKGILKKTVRESPENILQGRTRNN